MTQEKLAKKLNVSTSTIGTYEIGRSKPDIEMLQKIADVFGVSMEYLLGKTEVRTQADKVVKAIQDDPELLEFWNDLTYREEMRTMLSQSRDLEPEDMKTILRLIKRFKKSQSER